MPFVVCCNCGETRDKRLTVGFYHLVFFFFACVGVCVEIMMQLISGFIKGRYKYLWNETTTFHLLNTHTSDIHRLKLYLVHADRQMFVQVVKKYSQ